MEDFPQKANINSNDQAQPLVQNQPLEQGQPIITESKKPTMSMETRNKYAVVSLILSIISVALAAFGYMLGILILVMAFVMAICGLKSEKKKMAIAALVLLVISVVITVVQVVQVLVKG